MSNKDIEHLRKQFADIINRGESITIVYYGGTQPGTKRLIAPISVFGNRIRALDHSTDTTKIFALEKIELVDQGHSAQEYLPKKTISNKTRDLVEIFKTRVEELERLGWDVRLTVEVIKLYKRRKDGSLESNATVGLRRNYDAAIVIGLKHPFGRNEMIEAEKPWYVFAPDLVVGFIDPEPEEGRPYKYLSKAVEIFLEQAKKYAPRL